jgi:DNA polymerase-3 subunit epsilon/ATP-dependent DNA helicase DinG
LARTYISLDLETTGLDAEQDAILEIGAVRFKGSQTLETYSTLVDPGRPVPYKIQHLTGITPADIQGAPTLNEVLPALRRFVGGTPLIGHNIGFDLGFLNKQGLFAQNVSIDTFELASILLPYASRYSLGALLDYLEIELPPEGQAHRALDDAEAAHRLFEALLDQARRLDGRIIEEVAQVSSRTDWPLSLVFQDLNRERSYNIPMGTLGQQLAAKGFDLIQSDNGAPHKPLTPVPNPIPLKIEQLCGLLEEGGLFDQHFDNFEHRPQQVDMLADVAGALSQSQHLLVEAGTGTGKSIAYLIPAIYWATQNGHRVVISTNTINLQDQLLGKDIPTLKKILPPNFTAVALKGRSNYVCPRRVELFRAKQNHSPKELRLLAKLLVWIASTTTGDREELFMPDYGEQALWSQVASDSVTCSSRTCTAESCFYARARRAAEAAHVIIVNHALLLADVAAESRVIPEYKYLIIDEAHHLEDSITDQLSFKVDQQSFLQLIGELSQPLRGGHPTGFIHEIARRCREATPDSVQDDLNAIIDQSHQRTEKTGQTVRQLFSALNSFVEGFPGGNFSYTQKIRLTEATRSQPAWGNVELTWDNTRLALTDLLKALEILYTLLAELEEYDVPDWDELLATTAQYRTRLEEIKRNLQLIITEPSAERILWAERIPQNNALSLHNAPLHVGDLVQEHLLKPKEAVVFTSATLCANNSFEFFQERLHLQEATGTTVGSPFDYEASTLLYLPTDIPEPTHGSYQKAMTDALIQLIIATKGRTLVLFTAYNHLRNTANAIRVPLAEAGIVVYQQGEGVGRRQLLHNFKTADQAVLLGTRSFWEGVDLPGAILSCVVITRLPFAVPTDPVIAARSETFKDAFSQYSIPQAILSFRQGFGRLIRTKDDRGVVAIFDRRVLSKSYGQAFLASLPPVTERRGPVADLPQAAAAWIEGEGE